MKIVINRCYGGFGLSDKAWETLKLLGLNTLERTDPKLIELVEEIGDECNGDSAHLAVVEIPDECTDWEIDDYDGSETITYVINGMLGHI